MARNRKKNTSSGSSTDSNSNKSPRRLQNLIPMQRDVSTQTTSITPIRASQANCTFINQINNVPNMDQNNNREQRIKADLDSKCCDCLWSLFKA